ncbi:hypothetical protein DCS_04460 [Drechmeria coniospora]|uniref:DUF1275 domain protein n=1 Tax=Drechmeria coniospora TaxID=98403 RepID=A0A151GK86_DRECN|nr:hypothetical protein DCS_04460 [Drechmeria coniospora]KYK57451.1 hypothetical protein DCS_04460 [Drechmeria coniospora]
MTSNSRAADGDDGGRGHLPCQANEAEPLLGRSRPRSVAGGWHKRMTADISRSRADLVLLLCYVVTGLLDSASVQVWGAFVSMQTGRSAGEGETRAPNLAHLGAGNTVYVGLGLASLLFPPTTARLYKSGVSLLSFCLGSFLLARFHRRFSPTKRWVLCVSFAAQTLFAVAAALVVTVSKPASSDAVDWTVLVPLVLVAFQSSGQAVASRALRYNALTSVVLTSIYCDLFSDEHLFARRNGERDRRAAAPLLLLLGAVVGGVFAHSGIGIGGALWTAAGLKLSIVLLWFLWPADVAEADEEG